MPPLWSPPFPKKKFKKCNRRGETNRNATDAAVAVNRTFANLFKVHKKVQRTKRDSKKRRKKIADGMGKAEE